LRTENIKLEVLKRQKEQAELALKAQIRIAKSVIKGHEPLNTYHFQQAIEEIKQFRMLTRKSKQSFKDLDLLISIIHLDSKIVKEVTSQFKFKLEKSKEYIESKYLIKNFEDMTQEEMANLIFNIHGRWIMKILPPITFEDIMRGRKYLDEKKDHMDSLKSGTGELQKVERVKLDESTLFSNYLLDLYKKVRKIASNRKLIKWDEIINPILPLEKKSRIAQGLSHLSFQNKIWLIKNQEEDVFQINE